MELQQQIGKYVLFFLIIIVSVSSSHAVTDRVLLLTSGTVTQLHKGKNEIRLDNGSVVRFTTATEVVGNNQKQYDYRILRRGQTIRVYARLAYRTPEYIKAERLYVYATQAFWNAVHLN